MTEASLYDDFGHSEAFELTTDGLAEAMAMLVEENFANDLDRDAFAKHIVEAVHSYFTE